jgi:hypothetical protein
MKKILSSIIFIVLLSSYSFSAVTAGPHVQGLSTAGNTITTASIDTTGMNLIVIVLSDYIGSAQATISDSKSNSYTGLTSQANASAERSRIYYIQGGVVGASHTFTATCTTCYPSIYVMSFSGVGVSPFDQQNGATTASSVSTFQAGSVTPTVNNELVVAGLSCNTCNTGATIDSSFVLSDSASGSGGARIGGGAAYIIQTTAGATNPTWSWSGGSSVAATIATFKETTPTTCRGMSLLGVGC